MVNSPHSQPGALTKLNGRQQVCVSVAPFFSLNSIFFFVLSIVVVVVVMFNDDGEWYWILLNFLLFVFVISFSRGFLPDFFFLHLNQPKKNIYTLCVIHCRSFIFPCDFFAPTVMHASLTVHCKTFRTSHGIHTYTIPIPFYLSLLFAM